MKFVKLDIFGFVDKPMRRKDQTSALKKFPKSKKFKITKVSAQKSPDRFSSLRARDVAEKAARDRFGDAPEYMGMSQKSMLDMASESYAQKASDRVFVKTIKKEMSASRLRTAAGIKGRKLKVKTPTAPTFKQQKAGILKGSGLPKSKPALKMAKAEGAKESLKTATKKSDAAFEKITERFTARVKASPFKTRSISIQKPFTGTRAENLREKKATRDAFKAMGIDDRVESNFRSRYYTKRTKGGKVLSDTFTKQVTDSQDRVLTGKKKRQALLFDKLFKD